MQMIGFVAAKRMRSMRGRNSALTRCWRWPAERARIAASAPSRSFTASGPALKAAAHRRGRSAGRAARNVRGRTAAPRCPLGLVAAPSPRRPAGASPPDNSSGPKVARGNPAGSPGIETGGRQSRITGARCDRRSNFGERARRCNAPVRRAEGRASQMRCQRAASMARWCGQQAYRRTTARSWSAAGRQPFARIVDDVEEGVRLRRVRGW